MLSMALFVAAPLSAVESEYIYKIGTFVNKEGKTIHVFHDYHSPNDETIKQVKDIMNQAKELDAAIFIEGPYVDEPNKRHKLTENKFKDLLLKLLYKQATADDGIDVKNVEVRSCPDCPIENALMQCELDDPDAYFRGELPVDRSFSEKLDVAFEQTNRNYVTAYEKHRETLENSEDGPVAQQYYDEVMENSDNNYLHRFFMNLPTEKKQSINNENPAYREKEQQIDSPQAILKRQSIKFNTLGVLARLRVENMSEEYGLIDTNIMHSILDDKEHDTIFVLVGGLHGDTLADRLTKLGYQKERKITSKNYSPVDINAYFSDEKEETFLKKIETNDHFDDEKKETLADEWETLLKKIVKK